MQLYLMFPSFRFIYERVSEQFRKGTLALHRIRKSFSAIHYNSRV